MQPTITPIHAARRRLAALALASTALLVLGACGSSSGSDASGTKATTTSRADGSGGTTDDGSTGATPTTTAGAGDLDLCAELTQADVEELLGGATLSGAKPQPALDAPNCDYLRTMGGGGPTVDGFVIRIVRSDPSYFDSQRQLQTDAVEVPGAEAFAYDDYGTVVVRGKTGTFEVIRGIELSDGGDAATQDQMIAIAKEVQDL